MKDNNALITTESPHDRDLVRIQEQLADDLTRVRTRLRELVAPPSHKIEGPILYAVAQTGRLLRPTLVLLSSYLLDGGHGEPGVPTRQDVIDAAAMVEILHIATLFHDDLIDEAQIRRGQPTANTKYGDDIALLTGDYLLARCMQAAAHLGVPHAKLMAQTLIDLCVGQIFETSQLHDANRTEQDYFTAISGKTAALLRTCTTLGAMQNAAGEDTQDALESFGHNLGMAFQIWDDILDFRSDDTGKEVAKDLRNGVYTLPVIYAVKDVPDQLLPALTERPLSEATCQEIVAVLQESGAIDLAAEVAHRHVTTAIEALRGLRSATDRAPGVERYLLDLVRRLAAQHPALDALHGVPRPTHGE